MSGSWATFWILRAFLIYLQFCWLSSILPSSSKIGSRSCFCNPYQSSPMQNGEPQMAHVAIKMIRKRATGMPTKTAMHCLEQSHQALFSCAFTILTESFSIKCANSSILCVETYKSSPFLMFSNCFLVASSAIFLISSTSLWALATVSCLMPVSLFL